MSFGAKKKDNKAPLIEEGDIQEQFKTLQNKYLDFIKYFDEMTDFETKLSKMSRKDYDKVRDDV
jgi:hypothetical protein